MARPQYPSDRNRKDQRPHAKVHLTVRHHPAYAEVFTDLEGRAIIWGLWVVAVEYQAARSGNRVTLTKGDLTWITGRTQPHRALAALRAQCELMEYPVSCHGGLVVVEVRNLQRKQGLRTSTPHDSGPSDSDSDSDSDSEVKKKRRKKEPPSDRPAARVSGGGSSPSNGASKPEPDPEAVHAFKALCAAIEQATPGASVPALGTTRAGKWLTELRLLHEIGAAGTEPPGWPWETILELIAWLPDHQRGEFSWGRVIRSAAKLRKHFATILAEKNAASRGPPMDRSEREQEEFWRLQRERTANAS